MLRKILIVQLAFLSCLFPHKVAAQQPWAQLGTEWTFFGSGLPGSGNFEKFTAIKDTFMLGKTVTKIRGRIFTSAGDSSELPTLYSYQEGSKVYYYLERLEKFVVLYDFSLKPGDTATFHFPELDSLSYDTTFRVILAEIKKTTFYNNLTGTYDTLPSYNFDQIDTIPTGFSGYTYFTYTERLGTWPRLMPWPSPYELESKNFICYKDSNLSITFFPNEYDCQNTRLSVAEPEDVPFSIRISPNPAHGTVKINAVSEIESLEIRIVSTDGKESIPPFYSNGEGISIDISNYCGGLYTLLVIQREYPRIIGKAKLVIL